MTKKRFTWEYSNYDSTGEIHDWSRSSNACLITDYLQKWELEEWCDELNKIVDENNQLRKENEQLKQGMIKVVDRYIKNVECNSPSSTQTYIKIKGALVNIREDLRDLIGDVE